MSATLVEICYSKAKAVHSINQQVKCDDVDDENYMVVEPMKNAKHIQNNSVFSYTIFGRFYYFMNFISWKQSALD